MSVELLNKHWPAIVFCRTKHGADRLAKQLGHAGVSAVPIHGNLSQPQRARALAAFSDGRAQALVATDVAARGIHVDDVACVVHFDLPADEKDYVHRSGRTGRAGAAGLVVSLVGNDQLSMVKKWQRTLGLRAGIHQADVSDLGEANDRPVPAAVTPLAPVADRPAHAPSGARQGFRGIGRGRGAASGDRNRNGNAGNGHAAKRNAGSPRNARTGDGAGRSERSRSAGQGQPRRDSGGAQGRPFSGEQQQRKPRPRRRAS